MNFLVYISNMIIPIIVFYFVGIGLLMRQNVYEDFIKGAENGIKVVFRVMPTLIGLMVGVGVMSSSGLILFITNHIGFFFEKINIPKCVIPVIFTRMFSSSAATGLSLDIFKKFGTDSYEGLLTAIMMSSTETIFYTMSVYFAAARVTKTKWTLQGALISTFAGIIASIVIAKMMV